MTQTTYRAKLIVQLVALSFLMGCNSTGKRQNVFNDSTFFDQNRAPSSMTPQPIGEGDSPIVDTTYLRSQADYHYTLGEAVSLEGDHKKAIEEFKLTLLYDSESAAVHHRIALEYMKMGLVGEAIESAEESLGKDAKFKEASMLLGGIYTSLKMYDQAYAQYQQIISYSPDDEEAPLYIGALLAEQKKFDQAVAYFQKFTKNSKGELVYLSYYYIGRIRLEQGGVERDKLAEDAFKKVLELKPTHAESAIALASIYEERKNRPQAMQLLENFQMKRGPNPQIALILAQHYIESKKEELALEQYKIVEANSEDDLNAKVKVALLYVELKRFPEAIAKLEEILILVPESDKIRFYLGAVYEEINEIPSAIAQFRKIPTSSPFYVESVIHEAYLQKLSNNVDEAIATVKEGIENRDDVPQMYTLYASLLDDKKEYQKAVSMLTGAIEKIPTDTQLHFYLGSMYDKLGDKKLTIASMRKVLELDAEHVRALNYLAYTYAETDQNLDEAEQMARKALRKNPTDVYIMDTLGWVLYKQGNGQESVKLLEVAHNTKPDESIIAEHLGDAYFKLQLHEKARRMYNVVLEIEKDETTLAKVRQKLAGMDGVSKFQHRKPASLDQNQDNSK